MCNRIDESLNEYLKRIYGTSAFRKKITVEIKMELNHNNQYEIKEAYCPKEEIGLKINKEPVEDHGGGRTDTFEGGSGYQATPFERKIHLIKKGRNSEGGSEEVQGT